MKWEAHRSEGGEATRPRHWRPMTTTLALDCPVQLSGRAPLHPGRPRGEHQRLLLLALVDADPGIHVLRAAHLLDISWNTCEYHSRRLAGEGRIIIRKVQGRLCLFGGREGAS
ncbi:MAG TPA: hypothetical protein VM327_00950, partial [Candidatus Thermoplasmatota archaeon]|nr:hypothetical protein [Candidatus Thermoplasmatota archaeon]